MSTDGTLNLLRAEWLKATGHRKAAFFLIWIFPVGTLALMVLLIGPPLLVPAWRADMRAGFELASVDWRAQAIGAWKFANSALGRTMMLAFTAVLFAGEYSWDTWKNTLPHQRRSAVVLAKFVTVGLLVLLSFTLMALIAVVGMGLLTRVVGGQYGPAPTADVLRGFAADYMRQAGLAFTLALIAAGYAALASMFTRSILGGAIVSIIATYGEGLSLLGLVLLANLLGAPALLNLYRLTPSYNVDNIQTWLTEGTSAGAQMGEYIEAVTFSDGVAFSAAMLATWVVGLLTLTAFIFRRQDIT